MSMEELQDQFVAKCGGYFSTDHRFCAKNTGWGAWTGNWHWCNFLYHTGAALEKQYGHLSLPEHPAEKGSETGDFRCWRLTMWYQALVAKAKAEAKTDTKPRLVDLQEAFRLQFREQRGEEIVFVLIPDLYIPYAIRSSEFDGPVSIVDAGADTDSIADPYDGTEFGQFTPKSEIYWDWIRFIETTGRELVAIPREEPRTFRAHRCWHLWIAVTWFENLCWVLKGEPIPESETLAERDRDMTRRLQWN